MSKPLAALFLTIAGLAGHSSAQDAPPAFRVGADLVVLDLVAVDRAGRVVTDLKVSEIEVREDGRVQTIAFLQLTGAPSLDRGDALSAQAGATTSLAAAPPPTAGTAGLLTGAPAHLVLVLDVLSTPADAVPRLREALLQVARSDLSPDVPVMLATIGHDVEVRLPFTTDRPALVAALETLPAGLDRQTTVADVFDRIDRLCHLSDATRITDAALDAGRALIQQADERSAAASRSLSILSQSLGALPGRKSVVLYSAGYAVSPTNQAIDAVIAGVSACAGTDMMRVRHQVSRELGPLGTSAATDGLRSAVDRANRTQTTFYTVDPRGLSTDVVQPQHRGSARTGGRGPLVKLMGLDPAAGRDYLERLAVDTGGRTFINTNDIGGVVRRAWLDASSYYLIGYAPASSRKKGRFRQVTLTIRRPDLDLRYRRGYVEWTERELAERDIEHALQAPGAFAREGFEVSTAIDGRMLKIVVGVPPAGVRFIEAGAEHRADFAVHAELRDAKGALVAGKPLPGKDVALRVTGERLAALRAARTLRVLLETPVPASGSYVLAVAARDSSGWMAARSIEVAIDR